MHDLGRNKLRALENVSRKLSSSSLEKTALLNLESINPLTPFLTSFKLNLSCESGNPILARKSLASVNSDSFLDRDQPNSDDIISMTLGRASNAADAFKKDNRVLRAMISVALTAYSLLQAYRISACSIKDTCE